MVPVVRMHLAGQGRTSSSLVGSFFFATQISSTDTAPRKRWQFIFLRACTRVNAGDDDTPVMSHAPPFSGEDFKKEEASLWLGIFLLVL